MLDSTLESRKATFMHQWKTMFAMSVMAMVAMTPALTSAQVTLIEAGEAEATLYAPQSQRAVVEDLNYHLERMSGATLEVVWTEDADEVTRGPALVIGPAAAALGAAVEPTDTNQAYRLLVNDEQVLIAGEGAEGPGFGIYALLRRLGCDWVMPGEIGEIIPERATVTVEAMDEQQSPSFLWRRLWYRGYPQPRLTEERERFEQWLERQQMGGSLPWEGNVAAHTSPRLIRRHQDEFDADPSMLALVRMPDGTMQRRGPQIETTHPRIVELYVEDIKKDFEENDWPKDRKVGYSVGPADGLGYSESTESQLASSGRIDPIVGAPDTTDLYVQLANNVLEALGDEYPNVHVGFYNYSTHADYPARYHPHPRLVQVFADINFSRFHDFSDTNSKTRAYYQDVVEQWAHTAREQGNPLVFRGYNWSLADNMIPFTRLKQWGVDLPFYHEHGFIGLNVEATKAWSINGPHDYVYARLAWDASQGWRELLRDYCEASFGQGADMMERYFLRMVETQHGAGQEAGSYHAAHLIYDHDFIEAGRRDLTAARSAARTEAQRTRIEHFADALTALELYLDYFEASTSFDFDRIADRYDAMHEHWQTSYDENTDLVANETPAYLERFIEGFVEQGRAYSTGDYRIVHEIPDELPTMLDPREAGEKMRYHHPDINDTHYFTTRTYSAPWDAQGLVGMRDGAVWYRIPFELPEDAADEPIGLFLGGFEDEARVYLNGERIGTSGRRFSNPAAFDLTDEVDHTRENLLAVQIVRNSKANEIGLGGLIRPSFIFAGPRLEQRAPDRIELRRILPGGEMGEVIE